MITVAGIVLRCKNRRVTALFYSKLGLLLDEHRHEGGPLHFGANPVDNNFVMELYNASPEYPKDALMLEVPNLQKAIDTARTLGSVPKKEPITGGTIRFVYVTDPDGREVMLFEKVA